MLGRATLLLLCVIELLPCTCPSGGDPLFLEINYRGSAYIRVNLTRTCSFPSCRQQSRSALEQQQNVNAAIVVGGRCLGDRYFGHRRHSVYFSNSAATGTQGTSRDPESFSGRSSKFSLQPPTSSSLMSRWLMV